MSRSSVYEVPRGLRVLQKVSCVRAGMAGRDPRLLEEKMAVPVLLPSEEEEAALKRNEDERIRAIRSELRRLARLAPGLVKALKHAESAVEELVTKRRAAEQAKPLSTGSAGIKAITAVLLGGEVAFTFITLCDTWGIDISQGADEIPATSAAGIGAVSLLIVLVSAVLGSEATSPASPRRRFVGGAFLVLLALCLAAIRVNSVGQGGLPFAIVGAMVTVSAGIFGGWLQRRLWPILRARREHARKLALASRDVAEAEGKAAAAKQAIAAAEARRRSLLAEAAALASRPQERAARRTEVGLIQAARLKSLRWYFHVGRRWAGKDKKAEEATNA